VLDLALEQGYFAAEGVDVQLVRVEQTPSAVQAILAGEGEMANVAVDAVIQLNIQGEHRLRAVTSPNKSLPFLIAARDPIATPADLAGKRFGVGRVGSLDYSLSASVLGKEGVDFGGLQIVSLGQPNVRAQALAAGQIDATTMSEGTWLAMPDHAGLTVVVPQDRYYAGAPVVNKVNVVSADVLEKRRPEVEAVVRALVKISRDYAADPAKWAKAMEAHSGGLSPKDLGDLATSFTGSWSVNGGMNKDELQYTEDFVMKGDDFKGATAPALDSWVDFSVVDSVLAALGTAKDGDTPGR
jgi:NitT/TauT family transport system substrate-binding protein